MLVLHLLILEEHAIFALGHADRVEQVAVGGDVHRLHVGEGGEHHLDLGRLEHAAIFVVVAILHLDIGLGEEAEDLGEQVALVIGELLRPVAAILAERHFLRHPVDLLLALPVIERPGIFEGLVLLAGFGEGHVAYAPWRPGWRSAESGDGGAVVRGSCERASAREAREPSGMTIGCATRQAERENQHPGGSAARIGSTAMPAATARGMEASAASVDPGGRTLGTKIASSFGAARRARGRRSRSGRPPWSRRGGTAVAGLLRARRRAGRPAAIGQEEAEAGAGHDRTSRSPKAKIDRKMPSASAIVPAIRRA